MFSCLKPNSGLTLRYSCGSGPAGPLRRIQCPASLLEAEQVERIGTLLWEARARAEAAPLAPGFPPTLDTAHTLVFFD